MPGEVKNVTISKEHLDKIRRFAAIRPDESFEYVPKAYRDVPAEIQAKFTLRPVSGEDALRFSDTMRGEVTVENGKALVKTRRGEFVISVVRRGLLGWENYLDASGRGIPFSVTAFEHLPLSLLEELADEIVSRSSLDENEVLGLR